MRRRIPEDVALVGFDDLPEDLVTFPFLTVSAQPAYEMGQKAMELLLERMSGESLEGFQRNRFTDKTAYPSIERMR